MITRTDVAAMDRRGLLGTLALLAAGGCADTPADDPIRLDDASIRDTGRCGDPEAATVDASPARIRVAGCVTGPNGCAVASFGSARVENERLTVVVTTRRAAPPSTACTEALVYRGYVATVSASREPTAVRVVHETPGGRRTVEEWPEDS